MEQLENMKQTLMNCVQGQLGNLASVDAKELGEAVDMIKDLSEAIYYCTVTEAMKESEKEEKAPKEKLVEKHYPVMYYPPTDYARYYPMEYDRDMDRGMGKMYYNGGGQGGNSGGQGGNSGGGRGGNSGGQGGGSRNYPDGNRQSRGESRNYGEREYPIEFRDYREGRSPMTRKNYMENKEMHMDKGVQMQHLEKYMQELSHDLTEMIEDSSPEEKQMLQKKLSALATKIV